MKPRITLLLALIMVLGACADDATGPPADGQAARAPITGVEFLFLESYPVQVHAVITGELPTPCHTLGTTVLDEANGRVVASAWIVPPDDEVLCAQVIEQFEITLVLGSFETGDYVLDLNGTEYPFTI